MSALTEYLRQIFLQVYHLSAVELAVCCAAGVMLCHGLHRKFAQRPWWRIGPALGLICWASVVLWVTILSRERSAAGCFQAIPFHSYREVLMGGNPEILRSSYMNVALFFPAGLLTALEMPDRFVGRRLVWVVSGFAVFSLGIELAQHLIGVGLGEIDDVLHNTLGSLLGYAGFALTLRGRSSGAGG